MRLFPHNVDFFKLFDAQAEQLQNAVRVFRALEKDGNLLKQARKLKRIEHDADSATHEIIRTLNQTFITPIDREDITLLASHLDDIVDELDRAISRLCIYEIDPLPKEIFRYGYLAEKAILEVVRAIREMRSSKNQAKVLKHCEIANAIENKSDEWHRRTLAQLFSYEKDPIKIMKLREIYEALENVTDRCEDAANVLETIVIKNF